MKLFQIFTKEGGYSGWINADRIEASGGIIEPYQYGIYVNEKLIGILRDVKIEEAK